MYQIKTLTWNRIETEQGYYYRADGMVVYSMAFVEELKKYVVMTIGFRKDYDTSKEAKSAAQKHYETEVKKHLLVVPSGGKDDG